MHDCIISPYVTAFIITSFALRKLWGIFPSLKLISEQWKEMGWQGKDPSTDFRFKADFPRHFLLIFIFCCFHPLWLTGAVSFRGGGFISLENLLYFARNFQVIPTCYLCRRFWEESNYFSLNNFHFPCAVLFICIHVTIKYNICSLHVMNLFHSFLTSLCNAACPYAAEIFPGPFEEAGWGKVRMGISFCCCWYQFNVHAHSDAWPWSRYMATRIYLPTVTVTDTICMSRQSGVY